MNAVRRLIPPEYGLSPKPFLLRNFPSRRDEKLSNAARTRALDLFQLVAQKLHQSSDGRAVESELGAGGGKEIRDRHRCNHSDGT